MKLKSVVLSMAVALFIIAMGNCFASSHINKNRELSYTIKLPKEYSAHFLFNSCRGALNLKGKEICSMPNLVGSRKKDMMCFMDNNDDIYFGGLTYGGIYPRFTLYVFNKVFKKFIYVMDIWHVFDVTRNTDEVRGIGNLEMVRGISKEQLKIERQPDGRYHINHSSPK